MIDLEHYFHSFEAAMIPNKEILQAKIDARHFSRELIRDVFQATEHFPKNDPDQFASLLRKKVLSVSSFLAHGTVKHNTDEQKDDLLVVMGELRETLKLITIANHLGYATDYEKAKVRQSIANVINALDKLVIKLGGFE